MVHTLCPTSINEAIIDAGPR